MNVRDLSAIYLGGTPLAALARAGLVTERTKGAAAAREPRSAGPSHRSAPIFLVIGTARAARLEPAYFVVVRKR